MNNQTRMASVSNDLVPLNGRRVLLVATGCVGALMLPNWISWWKASLPETQLKVVLTRSALNFTTTTAVSSFLHDDVLIDEWDYSNRTDLHIHLSEWPDAVLVHPASMNFVSRLAIGLCDTPLMLALQGSTCPVVVAASAPPNFTQGAMWGRYQALLSERENISLLPPTTGISALRPNETGAPAVILPEAAQVLAQQFGSENVA